MQTSTLTTQQSMPDVPSNAIHPGLPTWLTEMFAAVDAFDVETFLSFLAPDCMFRFGNTAPIYGHDAIRAAVAGLFAGLKGIGHANLAAWVHPHTVICRGDVTYTRHDDSTLTVPFAVIFKRKNDLVQEYLIYVDISQLFPTDN